jgi:hypothetical protein
MDEAPLSRGDFQEAHSTWCAPRQSHNQKGISNNEQGMSNVEGKRAYKLHHSSFDIPCSIFKNVFPENYKHEKLGEKFSPENALY